MYNTKIIMKMYTKEELKYLLAFYHIDRMPVCYDGRNFVGYVTKDLKYEQGRGSYMRRAEDAITLACEQIDNIVRVVKKWNDKVHAVCEDHYEHDVWNYADKDGVVRHHVYPRGTFDEVCEKMEKENNRLRYCNGSWHQFQDEQMQEDFKLWYRLIPEGRRFNLYYGNGVVD